MTSTKATGTVKPGSKAKAPTSKSNGAASAAAATGSFEASGAPAQLSGTIDSSHAAVDADPRAAATADQNRIDFNDPTKSGAEAVAENLAQASKEVEGE